jgi:hypothetical protein
MTSLNTAIIIVMASMAASAQQAPDQASEIPAGVYFAVSQNAIYIIQDGKQLDVKEGQAAFAGEDALKKLDAVPAFLNWPCGGSGGEGSGLVPTYPLDSLPSENRIEEIVRRFFEGPEIPASKPIWLSGGFHGRFSAEEINRFTSNAHWYVSGKTTAKMEALRPRVLLIFLYPATQQVIVDQNHFQELLDFHGSEDIPVTFVFNEENVVPVSSLGKNATMQQIADLYFKKGITIANVPMWYAGDWQLAVSPGDLEQAFEIPAIEDIDPSRLTALIADLRANGFTQKPIKVALMSQNNSMVVDEGEKIRAAQSIGIDSIPIVFFYYSENSHKKHCGLAMPQVAAGGGVGEGDVASAIAAAGAGVTAAESLLAQEKLASDN